MLYGNKYFINCNYLWYILQARRTYIEMLSMISLERLSISYIVDSLISVKYKLDNKL